MTSVRVNTYAYAATHVATNMLRSLRQIVRGAGLDPAKMTDEWEILERGVAAWMASRHLRALILEVYDPSLPSGRDLVGRFDFSIDYEYGADDDGELWLDPDTVSYAVRKNGSYPASCTYRFVADTAPGYPAVTGWSTTTLRSTSGFTKHSIGAAIGGATVAASLAYYIGSQ